jgi:hypothetical protein
MNKKIESLLVAAFIALIIAWIADVGAKFSTLNRLVRIEQNLEKILDRCP